MKDIDFDELDKAVNSLMGTASATSTAGPTDTSKPSLTPAGANDTPPVVGPSQPTPVAPSVAASPVPPVSAPRTAAPAQRRGGRFMDMVHTSSDMKTGRPSQTTSREGISVAPRQQPTDAPQTEQMVSETPAVEAQSKPVEQAWPDPLELATVPSEQTELSETSPEVELTAVPQPESAGGEQPLESPFLTDAKVEKRPLNPGTPAGEPLPVEQPVVSTNDSETPRPFVPAELNSDLVAIESGEPKTLAVTDAAPVADSAPTAPAGPTSIAQQYREEPNSGDQSHAAIYDASQFQAPLSHPAKKKSGWLWVVWVVLLLALGAGGAVALYMADLI